MFTYSCLQCHQVNSTTTTTTTTAPTTTQFLVHLSFFYNILEDCKKIGRYFDGACEDLGNESGKITGSP
jgi:hypothetical protein